MVAYVIVILLNIQHERAGVLEIGFYYLRKRKSERQGSTQVKNQTLIKRWYRSYIRARNTHKICHESIELHPKSKYIVLKMYCARHCSNFNHYDHALFGRYCWLSPFPYERDSGIAGRTEWVELRHTIRTCLTENTTVECPWIFSFNIVDLL